MKSKKGFTLVEVMIVVAIIGLLAAIGIPSIMNAMQKAQDKAKLRNIASVEKAKAMLQLPSTIHAKGIGATDGATVTEEQIMSCMNGTEVWANLAVDGTALTENDIGTSASY